MTTTHLNIPELPNSVRDPRGIVNNMVNEIEEDLNSIDTQNFALDDYLDNLGGIIDYALDESSGNALDRKGVLDLTTSGTITYQQSSGLTGAGDGYDFDGSTGYLLGVNGTIFDAVSTGFIVLCFEVDSMPAGSATLFSYSDNASNEWWFVIQVKSGGEVQVSMRTSSSSFQYTFESAASTITTATVYTLIVTQDGVEPKAWLDGSPLTLNEIGTSTLDTGSFLDGLTASENVCLAAFDRNTTTNYFSGKIYRAAVGTTIINNSSALNLHNALDDGSTGGDSILLDNYTNLIAYYKCETYTSDTLVDVTTNYDGTGSNTPTLVTGYDGNGIDFANTDAKIDISGLGTATDDIPFSVSFWFKLSSAPSTEAVIIACHESNSRSGWMISVDTSGHINAMGNDASDNQTNMNTSFDVCDGLWHHIAVVFDPVAGEDNFIYVDGAQENITETDTTWSIVTTGGVIARSPDTSWNDFDGTLDLIRVFDEKITASQVVSLFQE